MREDRWPDAADPSASLLAVIDLQNGFLNQHTMHILPTVKAMTKAWLAQGGTVVFSRYHNFAGSPYERLLHWYKLRDRPDTDLTAELDEVLPQAAAIIDKTGYTIFGPELEKLIAEQGPTGIVLCG